jgi:hypothetical protein
MTPNRPSRSLPFIALFVALVAALATIPTTVVPVVLAQNPAGWTLPVTFRAFAVDMTGTTSRSRAGTLEITVERWSSEEEREKLRVALVEGGSDQLLETLQKMPRVGYIRNPMSIGWDLHYATAADRPSGAKRVIVATDRPMGFYELWNRPRSADYEFTLAEIRIGPNGKGEGKLVKAAKITYDKDMRTIEIEDYGIEPVRLSQVEVIQSKKATKK